MKSFTQEQSYESGPETATHPPTLGEYGTRHTQEELLLSAAKRSCEFQEIPGGYMSVSARDAEGRATHAIYWDVHGRLWREDWSGGMYLTDRSGPNKGEPARTFSKVYEYAPNDRVIAYQEVVTQNDGATYILDERRYVHDETSS